METFATWMYAVSLVLWGLAYSYTSFKKAGLVIAKETADKIENSCGMRPDEKKIAAMQDVFTIVVMFLPWINTIYLIVGFIVGIQKARAKRRAK